MLVRHAATGELVGVSTVGLKPRPTDGPALYHFRMFLRREHRRPYLMRAVTNGTRDFLRAFRHPSADPAGMLIVTENRKLLRAGIKRYLARHGYEYRGRGPRGPFLPRLPKRLPKASLRRGGRARRQLC